MIKVFAVTKCLLCTRQFQDKISLKSHYKFEYKLSPSNWFFRALFEEGKEDFFLRRCYSCDKFLTSRSDKKQNIFLFHYQKGGQIPLENRPIIIKTDGTIKKFIIEYVGKSTGCEAII